MTNFVNGAIYDKCRGCESKIMHCYAQSYPYVKDTDQ